MGFIFSIIFGAIAGWLAGQILKGKGFGALGNIVVGIVGGMIGSVVFRLVGLNATNIIGELITAVVGAIILIFVVRQIRS